MSSARSRTSRGAAAAATARGAGRNEGVAEAAQSATASSVDVDGTVVATPRSGCSTTFRTTLHADPFGRRRRGRRALDQGEAARTRRRRELRNWRVAAAGVEHVPSTTAFVPTSPRAGADRGAQLGDLGHFRGRYPDWGDTTGGRLAHRPRRPARAPWETSPRTSSTSRATSSARSRPSALPRISGREVDDAVEATVETRRRRRHALRALALGRRNPQWEVNGTMGSLAFDMERLNDRVFRAVDDRARGSRPCSSPRPTPLLWSTGAPGHIIGWGDAFVHEATSSWVRSRATGTSHRRRGRSRTATAR